MGCPVVGRAISSRSRPSSRLKSVFFLFLWLSLSSSAARAQAVNAVIGTDLRLFTVVAALNAAGFDVELAAQYHPVRQQVRAALADVDRDLLERLQRFYAEHKGAGDDDSEFASYISLALNLTDPPDLTFAFSPELVPPDARGLEGFLPLLREFYREAPIAQLRNQLAPSYDEAINTLAPAIRGTILQSDAYLREPFSVSASRQLVILVELAAPVNSVNVRNYPDSLYVAIGDPTTPPLADVRHAYLHLLLDPIVARSRRSLGAETRLTSLLDGVDGVRSEYAGDFELMVTESLIRSVELVMDEETSDLTGSLGGVYRTGLLLAPHFYSQLEDFEASEVGIREFFPGMLASIDFDGEIARFEERFSSIEVADQSRLRSEVPRAVDPVPGILRQAEVAFNAGEDAVARAAFERVLNQFDSVNGPALYGIALIASREGDPELAQEYFSRTLASDSAEPAMRVWSHVYLGRIYDLQCEREAALEQYRSATELGDNTQGAQAAAARGIAEPFGPTCSF